MENIIDLKQIEKEIITENKVRMVNDDFQFILPAQMNEQLGEPEVNMSMPKAEEEVNRKTGNECGFAASSYRFDEAELRDRVATIHMLGNNLADRPLTCKRNSMKGLVKRVIRKLIRWYVEPISGQQSEFNQETVMLTSRMVDAVRDMGNYLTEELEPGIRQAMEGITGDLNDLAQRSTEHENRTANITCISNELGEAEDRHKADIGRLDTLVQELKAECQENEENTISISTELREAENRHKADIGRLDTLVQELKAECQRNEENTNGLADTVHFLENENLGETVVSLANRMENEEKFSRLYQEQINQLLRTVEVIQSDVCRLQEELNQQKPKYEFGSIISSSQSGEDTIVAYILDSLKIPFNKCTYLDLGANHPIRMNNSYMLYRFGARGVLVEANPTLAKELQETRPGDVVLNRCIANTTGESIKFYVMNGDGLSTFDADRVARNMQVNDLLQIEQVVNVKSITIQDIVDAYFREPPVVVSVDIEGDELESLERLNLKNMRPLIVIVETIEYSTNLQVNRKKNDVINYMNALGYAEYAFTGINSIFVDVNRLHS